ncbi:DUF5131 family protein [Stakelama pacifica]|uniref:Protein gp37 n=1 Tax=Stakelama pacifica TaxID=517720 RepID=A0A4R6FJU7_9SPHN|nr:DUF5131 family protein [Stakelama pacifica]TDN81732.1 protein gp37 [Stakelama pacifica]GGO96394.1 hypothetical protein GCM10011329_22820 [Stakelama pacifica]
MAQNTKIEWCDHTFNPWIGCTRVGPGCGLPTAPGEPEGAGCYAETLMDHRYGRVEWGAGRPRARTAVSTWNQPRRWNRDAEKAETRPFVFCASLADVFDNEVPEQWRADLFELIEETPNLVWLLLTKRICNVRKMTDPMRGCRIIPPNVAIGATMVTQREYDRDARQLAEVKHFADVLFTFGSFEPLLGSIIIDDNAPDWIIVGGESGRNARPMDLHWARSLQRQAFHHGRVFNFKQRGGSSSDKGGHYLDGQTYFARPSIGKVAA